MMPPDEPSFEELTAETLPKYLQERHGTSVEGMEVAELGGGISNVVLRYLTPSACGVVKQSRYRLRVAEEWLCHPRRIFKERECMRIFATILPLNTVPDVIFTDDANYLFAMSCAPNDGTVWKEQLLRGHLAPRTALDAADVLKTIHAATWRDDSLTSLFVDDDLLRQVRIDPYYEFTARRNPDVADEIMAGADVVRHTHLALVPADYVPKNIFARQHGVFIVDFENAHYGHPAYDTASMLNHLLLKAWAFPDRRADYVGLAQTFWHRYVETQEADVLSAVVAETPRQLGCLMLARIDGKSPVEYLTDDTTRADARRLAKSLLRGQLESVEAALHAVEGVNT